MNRKDNRAACGVRRAACGSPSVGAAVEDDLFYAAWMHAACALVASAVAGVETPHAVRRTPHIAHVSHSSHTPEERKKLHPSVVSRLRLAQRFSRRELKDVPHA